MESLKLKDHNLTWSSESVFNGVSSVTPFDVFLALTGLFVFSSLRHKLTSKGPMQWPILGALPTMLLHFNDTFTYLTKTVIRAGGTFNFNGVWFAHMFGIVTVNPAYLEYVLKINFKNYPKGEYYRERFSELLGDGIFNADDESWKEQRRVSSSEMHSPRFIDYSARTIEDLVHTRLLPLADKLSSTATAIDFQDILLRFTFDNICMAAFGVDTGCLTPDLPNIAFAQAFEHATECSLFRFCVPPVVWKTMRVFDFGTERRLRESVIIVHEFAEKTVTDRRKEYKKLGNLSHRSDLLSSLIDAGNPLHTNKYLKDLCISFILAGRDTSSVALAWFFWLIGQNPHVENKILHEIVSVLKNTRPSFDHSNLGSVIFTTNELKQMEYLQAALSETLRLYPSVPIDFKQALSDDVFPDGRTIKKGARVIYVPYTMGRMEFIWGKDCMDFKPERWLNEEGRCISENSFKYPAFNAGPRLCVGKKFAYRQMKMVAASLMLRYKVRVVEGHVVEPKLTTTLYMKYGMLVRFEKHA